MLRAACGSGLYGPSLRGRILKLVVVHIDCVSEHPEDVDAGCKWTVLNARTLEPDLRRRGWRRADIAADRTNIDVANIARHDAIARWAVVAATVCAAGGLVGR